MTRIWAVTKVAIKENLRNRFIYFIFAAALVFILLGRGCAMQAPSPGQPNLILNSAGKISMHAVFHLIAGWSILLCSLLSMSAITKDLEEGTLVMQLARPISRSTLLLGKLLAVLMISVVTLYLLAGTFFVLHYTKTGIANPDIFLGYIGLIFSLVLTAIFGFFCSLILPRLAVPIVTLFIYTASMCVELLFFYDHLDKLLKPSHFAVMLNKTLPQFGEIQFWGATIAMKKASLANCALPAANLLFFSLILWGLLIFIFNRKEI